MLRRAEPSFFHQLLFGKPIVALRHGIASLCVSSSLRFMVGLHGIYTVGSGFSPIFWLKKRVVQLIPWKLIKMLGRGADVA